MLHLPSTKIISEAKTVIKTITSFDLSSTVLKTPNEGI